MTAPVVPPNGQATIVKGDARDLSILKSESVDLIVTSPPYWSLRSYTDDGEHYDGQIGAEPTPAEYVTSLIECTREWMRVLKPSGSLWVNLGDKYAERGGPERDGGVDGGQVNHRAARPRRRGTADTGVRAKSLIGLPWRYAIRCVDDLGLILRAEVIWSKPNGLPESVTDRVRRSHETWLHFTKSPRYFAAVDTIREAHHDTTTKVRTWGERKAAGVAVISGGDRGAHVDQQTVPNTRMAGSPLGKLPGSVWEIATQPLKVPAELGVDHYAAFPMEWPRRIIQGWAPSGGIVLDPFGGTGTTALVAKMLGRWGISIDMSADYCRVAEWRVNDPKQMERASRPAKPRPPRD